MKYERKQITITEPQGTWLEKNDKILSKMVQTMLQQKMKADKELKENAKRGKQ